MAKGRHRLETARPDVASYARHVGRVGALAVALGIGSALTGGLGVASADDTGAGAPKVNRHTDVSERTARDRRPVGQGRLSRHLESAGATQSDTPRPRPASRATDDIRTALASVANDTRAALQSAAHDTRSALESLSASAAITTRGKLTKPLIEVDTDRGVDVHEQSAPKAQPVTSRLVQVADELAARAAVRPSVPALSTAGPVAGVIAAAKNEINTVVAQLDSVRPAATPDLRVATAAPSTMATATSSTVARPTSVITGLLSAVGLGAQLTPNQPAVPADIPDLLAVLGWVRRQLEHTFANATPTATAQQVTVGLVTPIDHGSFTLTGATDPDPEDTVTYTPGTYTSASGATLVVTANGTATYTASPQWSGQAGTTDTFQVSITDDNAANSWHIHGLDGLLNAVTFGLLGDAGHTASQTVTVSPIRSALLVTPTAIDHADGTATGVIGWGGGPITYSNPDGSATTTWATTGGGTVTVTPSGEFSYTPDPLDRLNAYTHPGQNLDTFTIVATTADGVPHTFTVAVPIDPTLAVVTSTVTSTPPGVGQYPWQQIVVGADGTVAQVDFTWPPIEGVPLQTTVTVLHPGSSTATLPTITGAPWTDGLQIGADGTLALTTYSGSGSPEDPTTTTLTVLRPGDSTPTSITVLGFPKGSAKIGADGTIALTTLQYNDTTAQYDTTVTVLRPGDTTPITATITGNPPSAAQVGADGTVALTTYTSVGSTPGSYTTTVTVLRPATATTAATTTSTTINGNPNPNDYPSIGAQVGADGTVAQTTYTGTGTAADPYVTTVTVLRPGDSTPTSITINGNTIDGVRVGADGTVAQSTSTGTGTLADPYVTTVTVLRPGETTPTSITINGNTFSAARVGADGTVAQTTFSGTGQTTDVTTVTVLRPGATTPITTTITGAPIGSVTVGADGTVAQTTAGVGTPQAFPITVTVLRPGETSTPESFTITGVTSTPAQVGPDGTVVQTTYLSSPSPGVPGHTNVTIWRPGSTTPTTIALKGFQTGAAQFGIDGTVMQTTYTGAGTGADPFVYWFAFITLADEPSASVL